MTWAHVGFQDDSSVDGDRRQTKWREPHWKRSCGYHNVAKTQQPTQAIDIAHHLACFLVPSPTMCLILKTAYHVFDIENRLFADVCVLLPYV